MREKEKKMNKRRSCAHRYNHTHTQGQQRRAMGLMQQRLATAGSNKAGQNQN